MSSNLADRIRIIRELETSGRAEFCHLTGIAKKTLVGIEQTGRTPRGDILESICRIWPQYCLWLLTGHIGVEVTQISPQDELERRNDALKQGKASG